MAVVYCVLKALRNCPEGLNFNQLQGRVPTVQNWTRFKTLYLNRLMNCGWIEIPPFHQLYGQRKFVLTEKGESALNAFDSLVNLGLDIISEDVRVENSIKILTHP